MLVGDSGVGKTCLLVRFKDGAFLAGSFISTVGIDFRVSRHHSHTRTRTHAHTTPHIHIIDYLKNVDMSIKKSCRNQVKWKDFKLIK